LTSRRRRTTYHEKRNTLDSNVDEEESKSTNVVGDVEHSPLHVARPDFLVFTSASLRDQAFVRNPPFAFSQEPALSWTRRHQEGCAKANEQSEQAFEEEDVAPRVDNHA
jgi:hypothetical protein